jgi:hypothetical protein
VILPASCTAPVSPVISTAPFRLELERIINKLGEDREMRYQVAAGAPT